METTCDIAYWRIDARGRVQRLAVSSPHAAEALTSLAAHVSDTCCSAAVPFSISSSSSAAAAAQTPHPDSPPRTAAGVASAASLFSSPAADAAAKCVLLPSAAATETPHPAQHLLSSARGTAAAGDTAAAAQTADAADAAAAADADAAAAADADAAAAADADAAAAAADADAAAAADAADADAAAAADADAAAVDAAVAAAGAGAAAAADAAAAGGKNACWVVKTLSKRSAAPAVSLQAATPVATPVDSSLPLVEAGRYEGGFSIWEGTWDLLQYLLLHLSSAETAAAAPPGSGAHVLDLGCGHGLAGLLMLLKGKAAAAVFQDYNAEVLQEVTAPTVALNCCMPEQQASLNTRASAADISVHHRLRVCHCSLTPAVATPAALAGETVAVVAKPIDSKQCAVTDVPQNTFLKAHVAAESPVLTAQGPATPPQTQKKRNHQQRQSGRSHAGDIVPLLPKELCFPENCLLLRCSWSKFPRLCCSCCCNCCDSAIAAAPQQPQSAGHVTTVLPGSSTSSSCRQQLTFDWILASECIYRPDCFPFLYQLLSDLLTPETGQAVFAAKRFYFGLNGGTLPFKHYVENAERRKRGKTCAAAAGHSSYVASGSCAQAPTRIAYGQTQPATRTSSVSGNSIPERTAGDVSDRTYCSDYNGKHPAQTRGEDTELCVEVAHTIEDGGSNVRDILVIRKRYCC